MANKPRRASRATRLPTIRYSLRYPGQVDDGNGLFYNWHRFYDPRVGRYTSADPIGLAGGFNRFGYVGGNPLSYSDPEGLQFQGAAVACGPGFVFCACVITAATWGVYQSSQPHDPEYRRQRQYEAAKSRSCIPNPDPKSTCSELSKAISILQNARNRYIYFDSKYTPGRHDSKLEELDERIKKLKERHTRDCTDCM